MVVALWCRLMVMTCRWAANAIILPSLDLFSNLDTSHAHTLISHVITGRPKHGSLWTHWRGRYGLSEEEQGALWAEVNPDRRGQEQGQRLGQGQGDIEGRLQVREQVEQGQGRVEKVVLRFKTWEGQVKDVEASLGEDILQLGLKNRLPAIEGVCGGNLGKSSFHRCANEPWYRCVDSV